MSHPVAGSQSCSDRPRSGWLDALSLLGLGMLAAGLVVRSWLKWPDPLIDFGYQLYTPWRLATGAVLYRDIDHPYGPLSQYAHALLFRLSGPSLLTLVNANLIVYGLILGAVYHNLRAAWGWLAALAASAVFVSVFSFSQLVRGGNYTYAAPYTHEVTHGMLVCLALAWVLPRWLEKRAPGMALVAGLLTGLTVVLKPEFMMAAGWMLAAVFVLGRINGRRLDAVEWGGWVAGAFFPLFGFVGWLARDLPLAEAWSGANRAWLDVFTSHQVNAPLQRRFLGLDQPLINALIQTVASLKAAVVLGGIGGLLWTAGRRRSQAGRWSFMVAASGFALGMGGLTNWRNIGQCLPGLALLGGGWIAVRVWRARRSGTGIDRALAAQALMATLGLALLVRMALRARIYQFGFYQAAMAGVVVCAILLTEPPQWLRMSQPIRRAWVAACLLLLGAGCVQITHLSQNIFARKTFPVGEGGDRFLTFTPTFIQTGMLVEAVVERMRAQPPDKLLLMIPEGVMVNYLSRKASPSPTPNFFPITLGHGQEEKIVAQLELHPPDFVGLISRDLREYDIDTFGQKPGEGWLMLAWVGRHYHQIGGAGENPLDPNPSHTGVVLFQRNDPPR